MDHRRIKRSLHVLVAAASVATVASTQAAQKKQLVVLDPAQADADFRLQGEYAGQVDDDGTRAGMQIIALGDGEFRGVGYRGGLPGDGWDRSEKVLAEGKRNGDTLTLTGFEDVEEVESAVITNGVLTLLRSDGTELARLERVDRKSTTLGKKPPQGAVVLFDGKSTDQLEKAKMTKDGLLEQGTRSKRTFQNCTVHVEFRTPYMPAARGQGRGNSGVYLQGRYEVQVLDSFGLEGRHNEAGGIYSVKNPDVNMCFPPLSWQTYDIDFTAARFDGNGNKTRNARMTVRHNGVLVHKDVAVPKSTTAAILQEGAAPGPLYFQHHGNPVRYRNIWLVPRGE